jgi:hypothetical protein
MGSKHPEAFDVSIPGDHPMHQPGYARLQVAEIREIGDPS